MSVESADQLLQRLADDDELRNQLSTAETADERWAILKTEGFDFTESEYETARSRLSEEDLDLITGGSDCSCGNAKDKADICTNGNPPPCGLFG